MRIDLRHVVACPPPRLFAFLADPANRPRWQRTLASVQLLDAGPPHLGQRWRESPAGAGTFEMRITELDPQRAWAEAFEGRAASGSLRLAFAPAGAGTEVHVVAEVRLHGLRALASPLVAAALRREIARDLDRAGRIAGG